MLNITIPASGCVNIRLGFVVGVDGDVNGIMSTATNHNGLEYHAVQPLTPVLVLIAGRSANYALLDNNVHDQWTVLNQRHIIAWSGLNLDLAPTRVLSKLASYQATGNGTLVVNCDETGSLFNVEIKNGEEVMLNPNAVVATTTPVEYTALQKARIKFGWTSWLPQITLPRLGLIGLIGVKWDGIKDKIITKDIRLILNQALSYWHQCTKWVAHNIFRRIQRTPIYARVRGPAKLLLNTKLMMANGRLFTNSEIDFIKGPKP